MMVIDWVGATLNGWIAALGGIVVVIAIGATLRAYHELYVRRILWKIYEEVKRDRKTGEGDDVLSNRQKGPNHGRARG